MIRPATPADALRIAELIVLAMGPLAAKFIKGNEPSGAIPLFTHFAALPGNQYSYQNALVYQDDDGVCGTIIAYNGGDLELLREPFLAHISSTYGFTGQPENETQSGEYYIDCLSVLPNQQGKGIGKALIAALLQQAKHTHGLPLGLLVSKTNPKAQKLYNGFGFTAVGDTLLLGEIYDHMQCAI